MPALLNSHNNIRFRKKILHILQLNNMENNRRNFFKKSASLAAAAAAMGGVGSAMASPEKLEAKAKGLKYSAQLAKDGGMEFSLSKGD